MPCIKTPNLFNATGLLIMVLLLLSGSVADAQKQNSHARLFALDSIIPAQYGIAPLISQQHMYTALIDSLNKRKLLKQPIHSIDSNLTNFFQTTLKGTAFNGLKDSVMGEFLYYVKNNFGKDRLNKVIKNFSAAGDSGSLNNFIGNKIKGFYSVNGPESFKIPRFDNLLKNQFNGAQYTVTRDNSGMAPLPWMHQIQISDQIMLMDIPFQVGFSNLSNDAVPLQYNNLIKFSFNKDQFQQGLQQKLDKYYNMKKFLLADMDVLSYVKDHF